jgi:hypothetical protein
MLDNLFNSALIVMAMAAQISIAVAVFQPAFGSLQAGAVTTSVAEAPHMLPSHAAAASRPFGAQT